MKNELEVIQEKVHGEDINNFTVWNGNVRLIGTIYRTSQWVSEGGATTLKNGYKVFGNDKLHATLDAAAKEDSDDRRNQ